MVGAFEELLNTWRKQKRLSFKELARQSGVSGATLSRWEAGRTQPRMAELEAVLAALQVSPTQRQEALALMEAPRALQQLRETPGAGGPPVSGDLLRAMRLRKGWTQQETARRAGIAQATLARWERSSDWPSVERLHTLCYALQAHEEELIALTQGFLVANPPMDVVRDDVELRYQVAQSLFYSPLADLEFLALEAQLWHLSRRNEAAQIQLSSIYGSHARYLVEHHRFQEAAPYVARTQQMASSGYRDSTGWADAVVAASRIVGARERPLFLQRAVNLLHTWTDREPIAQHKEYRAWMISEIARYLAKMGHAEPALVQSKRALRIASEVNLVELWCRRGDYAKVLVQIGRYTEALVECNACLSMGEPLVQSLPFMLTGVEALLGAVRPAEAREWLNRIYGIIESSSEASHYRAVADALRQRLPE